MKKLFTKRPNAEELVAMMSGEIEAEFICDFCIKDCKKKPNPNWTTAWCEKSEFMKNHEDDEK